MHWRKSGSTSVELATIDRGVVVSGRQADVAAVVDRLMQLSTGSARTAGGVDVLALAGAVVGVVKTHKQYIEFSPKTWARLQKYGAVPARGGYFRGYVRDAQGRFAGIAQWRPISLGPQQALSIQTAAAMFAIRVAIQNVVEAVERVEGKVDELVTLVRAERLGTALGDRRMLEAARDSLHSSGVLTTTDWMAIGPLGPEIVRDIERLRAHVGLKVGDVKGGWLARTRVEGVESLAKELVRESISLLVLAEYNLGLWQELRLAHIAQREPEQLESAVTSARALLQSQLSEDELLLERIAAASEKLTRATGLEGFEPIQRRRLRSLGEELEETCNWFAQQRNLDSRQDEEVHLPGFQESLAVVGRRAVETAHSATRAIGRGTSRLRSRSTNDARSRTSDENRE